MNQEELIEQIVERAAHAVEARIQPKQALDTVKQPEIDNSYNIEIKKTFSKKVYRVKSHIFATHDWQQKPDTGEYVLVPSVPALVLTLTDDSRIVMTNCLKAEFRIWR